MHVLYRVDECELTTLRYSIHFATIKNNLHDLGTSKHVLLLAGLADRHVDVGL